MNLSYNGIRNKKPWQDAGYIMPQFDAEELRSNTLENPVWLHLGAGNIFRLLIGGIAQELIEGGYMKSGIICAEYFDPELISRVYTPHNCLSTSVILNKDGRTEKRIIASICSALRGDSPEDRAKITEIFKNPSLEIVSFTVTEKAYAVSKQDISAGPGGARSAIGAACAMMYERYKSGAYKTALLSLDNCAGNGDLLRSVMMGIAEGWEKRGFTEKGFTEYLGGRERVAFPNSMIDRITPAPSEKILPELGIDNAESIVTERGSRAASFVNGERPWYLVIEDSFPGGRPPLEKAGVIMTDKKTVAKAESMKVGACLNPIHTALAVFGCLLGFTRISDEMKDAELCRMAKRLSLDEGLPTAEDPVVISPESFAREVLYERLPNPFIPDSPQRIACDTSQKLGVRFGGTIRKRTERGDDAALVMIPLTLAAWCRYLTGIDDNGRAFDVSPDPLLKELPRAVPGMPETGHSAAKQILSRSDIFGMDLYDCAVGGKAEAMLCEMLEGNGAVRKTLKKYL